MAKVKCCICGVEMSTFSLNCIPLQAKVNGQRLHECKECFKKYKGMALSIMPNGTAQVIQDSEIRKKCNTCGHLFCFTVDDINRNTQRANAAKMDSVLSLGQALGGAATASAVSNISAQGQLAGIVDYNRCPKCGSRDLRMISADEWVKEKAASSQGAASVSSADELKKFKELLDTGAITQEEFDAKKKQLLGL